MLKTAAGIAGGMAVAVVVGATTFILKFWLRLTVGWYDADVTARVTAGDIWTMRSGAGRAFRNFGMGQSSGSSILRYSNLPYRL